MPSQDIPCRIYQTSTYIESYMLTLVDLKSSLTNLIILYFTQLLHSTFFFLPYHLGHFDFKALFLLRSYYKNPYKTREQWLIKHCPKSLPRTTKAKFASLLRADH